MLLFIGLLGFWSDDKQYSTATLSEEADQNGSLPPEFRAFGPTVNEKVLKKVDLFHRKLEKEAAKVRDTFSAVGDTVVHFFGNIG